MEPFDPEAPSETTPETGGPPVARMARRALPAPSNGEEAADPAPTVLGYIFTLITGLPVVSGAIFGGGSSAWLAGLLVAGLGAIFFLRPATHSPGWLINSALVFLLAWGLVAFLPAGWLGVPAWRETLTRDFGLALGGMSSAQPWVSLEAWLVMFSGVAWFSYCQGKLWHDGERRLLLLVIGIAAAAVAGFAVYAKVRGIRPSFWGVPGMEEENFFGPFPNRNHFATFLALGSVAMASFAWEWKRHRLPLALVALAALGLLFYATIENKSRAGVILVTFGVSAWFLVVALQMGSLRRILLAGSVVLILVSTFLFFGGTAVNRLGLNDGVTGIAQSLQKDWRTRVWSDSLRLMAAHPVGGVGLGNFEPVFALNQSLAAGEHRVTNPESDWLWWTTELGIPGFLALVFVLGWTFRSLRVFKGGRKSRIRNRRFRAAAMVMVLVVVLHGLFDTPAHTYGIALPALLCLGLARSQRDRGLPNPWVVLVSRASGIVLIGLGVAWWATDALGMRFPGQTGARTTYIQDVTQARASGDLAEASRLLDRSISWQPLHWSYYYAKGRITLESGGSASQAMADLRRARYLAADLPRVPYAEVRLWMEYFPPYAIAAMREVLLRDPQRLEENYDVFLSMAGPHPELMNNLRTLSRLNNRLRVKVLPMAEGQDARDLISGILEEDPELTTMVPRQREMFFSIWAEKVSRATVLKALEENAGWREYGWRVIAADLVDKGDHETACKMADRYLAPSGLSIAPVGKTIRELDRDARLNPTDFLSGVYYMQGLKDDIRYEEALAVLEKIAVLPTATDALLRERAYILSHLERYEEAWEYYQKWDASPLSKQ